MTFVDVSKHGKTFAVSLVDYPAAASSHWIVVVIITGSSSLKVVLAALPHFQKDS
jgi:hypothetical protein